MKTKREQIIAVIRKELNKCEFPINLIAMADAILALETDPRNKVSDDAGMFMITEDGPQEIEQPAEELYRKVYIKTEADLPKEEGYYFCNRSGFNSVQHLMTTLGKSYMREIRWYLQSIAGEQIEQKESKGMKKETVKKIILWTQDALHYGKITGSDDDIAKNCMKDIEFDALCNPDIYEASYNEWFERQPKQEEEKPTDEEIEKWADRFANPLSKKAFERGEWFGIKEGAKAMRDNPEQFKGNG
jgi:hypothetical protein